MRRAPSPTARLMLSDVGIPRRQTPHGLVWQEDRPQGERRPVKVRLHGHGPWGKRRAIKFSLAQFQFLESGTTCQPPRARLLVTTSASSGARAEHRHQVADRRPSLEEATR